MVDTYRFRSIASEQLRLLGVAMGNRLSRNAGSGEPRTRTARASARSGAGQ